MCFDCTGIDHRLYCTLVPEYVSLQRLLHIADFPSSLAVTVWAGPELRPVGQEDVIHTFPGMLFCFLHDGVEPQVPITLGQLLQFRSWNPPGEIPEPRTIHAYGLVYHQRAQLFISDPYLPTRHRQHIAEATGADITRMRLYAGSPRPTNAAINGVACKTILAVGDRHRSYVQPAWHLALLDCRLIGLGWRTVLVESGTFSVEQTLEDLDRQAPNGWQSALLDDPRRAGRLEAKPGQIFPIVFSFVDGDDRAVTIGQEAADPLGEGTEEINHGSRPGPGRDEPASTYVRGNPGQAIQQDRSSASDSGPVHAYVNRQDQTNDGDTPVPFLVFSQDYWPELVVVRLALPVGTHGAIAAVEQARDAEDHRGRSKLIPVFPQPREQQACLIAVPVWPFEGIAVLVDNRVANGSIFAIILPRFTTREALLRIAGLPSDSDHDVYLRDTPWPCTQEQIIHLSPGDLILICTNTGRPALFGGLDQLLQVARSWDRCPYLPGDVDDLSWVLSNGSQRAARVESDAFAANSNMVAQCLDLPPGQFTLVPASPPICDHARAGILSAHVLVACDTADYQPERVNVKTPFILDLRPILLEVSFAYAEDAIVDVSALGQRLAVRCPTGFHLRLYGGHYFRDRGNHYRKVRPGEVLKAEFLPDYIRAASTSAEQPVSLLPTDTSQGGDQVWDGPPEQQRDPRQGDAGTGDAPYGSSDRTITHSGAFQGSSFASSSDFYGSRSNTCGGSGAVCSYVPVSQDWTLVRTSFLHIILGLGKPLPLVLGIAHGKQEACPGYRVEMWALSLLRSVLVDGPAMLTTFLFHCTCFCLAGGIISLLCFLSAASRYRGLPLLVLLLSVHSATVRAVQLPKHGLQESTTCTHGHNLILGTAIGQPSEPFGPASSLLCSRPMATPCRAHSHRPMHAPHDDVEEEGLRDLLQEPLTTLLEESAWERDSHAFFEACTLLEVLVEHVAGFHTPETVQTQVAPNRPHILRLSEHLPSVTCHDVSSVALRLDTCLDQVALWFRPGSWDLATSLPPDFVVPPCVKGNEIMQCPLQASAGILEGVQVYTDGSFDGHSCSWAFCVFGHQEGAPCFVGWAAGCVPHQSDHPLSISTARASALCGEQHALFWAIVWCMQSPAHTDLDFFSDCLVALNQTTGLFGWSEGETLAPLCRAAMQALVAGRPTVNSQVQHVRSHKGTPANELADSLAKFVNSRSHFLDQHHCYWVAQQVKGGALPWLWLQVEATLRPANWPAQVGSTLVDQDRHSDNVPFTRKECHRALGLPAPGQAVSAAKEVWGRLHCITVNVQSLAEVQDPEVSDNSGFSGRARYLREQLQAMGVHVAALQEARSSADATYVSDSHIRFCTARDSKGNFGCELWFSRKLPFVTKAGAQAFFHPNDFLTVASGPRELFVRFSRAGTKILFLCIHAPVGGSPDRDAWWKELRQRIRRFSRNALVFLAGDFNTGFHHSIPLRVGDLVWNSAHDAPCGLEGILGDHDLWIPSTFSRCHIGSHDTWLSPSGTTGARLDYFAVSSSWSVPEASTWVETTLDWGQARVDHFGLGLVAFFPFVLGNSRDTRCAKFDREALHTAEGQHILANICEHIPLQPWGSNVHRHYAQVEAYLGQALTVGFPFKRGVCRSSHFSAATWDLRQRRAWLRKQIAKTNTAFRSMELRAALLSLKLGTRLCTSCVLVAFRGLSSFRRLQGLVGELRDTKGVLRHHIRQDILKRVSDTAAQAATTSKADVVSRLRPLLGPPKRKVRQRRALHGICHPNGEPAQTPDEAEDIWIRHFAGIEDGEKVDPLQLVESCHLFQSTKDLDAYELTADSLPTRTELEQSLRSTQTNRAIGLDKVPGELLHFAAGQASVALYQLFLKVSMRAAEPIQFKGGALFAIWKGKSSAAQCSAHRGILVSSTPGKSFHRVARQRAIPALQHVSSEMQIGGLPHFPVTMASHFVRAFQEGCTRRRRSYGLLFLDLREAFYRVVRPLLTGTSFCDEVVAHVAQKVRLPPGILHELHNHLRGTSLPEDAGATDWASAQICEAMQSTWFRFQEPHRRKDWNRIQAR